MAIENRGAYYGASYYAKLTLSNSLVENHTGENGPVFSNGYSGNATLIISNTTIRNNTVIGDGGAVTVMGHYGKSVATIENSNISNNQANKTGGGIWVFGTSGNVNLNVSNTVITQNKANVSGGGIVIEQGTVTVTNSTISKNSANLSGGGIALFNGALSVSKSTICDNTAYLGGAIYNAGATAGNSNVFLRGATVANNNATIGGGVYDANSTRGNLSFYNSIVANNTATSSDSDVKGIIDISQYSLYSSNVTITSNTSSILNTNPLLGVLGDYGGATKTISLLPGSPAIGNASASVYGSMDQRGYVYATSDIGAFAYNGITNKLLVSSTANSGAGSLRDAIAFAATNPGDDTITFFPNLMNGTITLTAPITINDATGSVTINGLGQSYLTISGGNSTGIFNIRSMTTISDVAIKYGKYQTIGALPLGGAIYNDHASLTLNNVTIANSSSEYGGAIYNDGSYGNTTLSISNSTITDNNVTYRGGAVYNDGWAGNATVSIINSTLARNKANSLGGAIFNNGRSSGKANLLINNSSLANNNATGNGGALYLDFSNLVMTGSTVRDNKSGGNGGAITTDGGVATFNSTQFISNTSAANGGAIDTGMNNTTVLITDSLFQSNLAPNAGGAIGHGVGSLTISNTTFQYNRATNFGGGAIFSLSGYTMSNSNLAFNNTTGSGGALYMDRNGAVAESRVMITGTAISLNNATTHGGAIFNAIANLTINRSNISQNNASDTGGSIYNSSGYLALTSTSLSENKAVNGGAVYMTNSNGIIDNSDIVNNNATGSGIIYIASSNLSMANTVISRNVAGSGSVLSIYNSRNSIIESTRFEDNSVKGDFFTFAGAIRASGNSSVKINNSTFRKNNSFGAGAVTNVSSNISINNSTFDENSSNGKGSGGALASIAQPNAPAWLHVSNSTFAKNQAMQGGAIYSDGFMELSGSVLKDNSAVIWGGAIELSGWGSSGFSIQDSGLSIITNTVITRNRITGNIPLSSNHEGGGAISNYDADSTFINCSIVENDSGIYPGGGINLELPGNITLINTIVAENKAGTSSVDVNANLTANSIFNLIGDGTGTGGISNGLNHNIVGNSTVRINPLLAPLDNYGGNTLTMPPLPGSPAIAAGTTGANVPISDQRGFARSSSVDIGSVQTQGFTVSNIIGSGQTATINANFTNSLGFQVTATNVLDPVAGGLITFKTPATGASASFNGGSNIGLIGSDGLVFSPIARANLFVGSYQVEATANGLPNQSFSLTNAAPVVTGFVVQKGSVGRSFMRYVDLSFNTTATLNDIVASISTASPRIRMANTGLDGNSNVNYSLAGKLAAIDAVLSMDFGDQGIGGDRNSAVGDGSYLIEMDLDGNGSFETSRRFFRLLGDVNGDKVVDALDANLVAANIGATGSNVAADINGDGVVNARDTLLVKRQKGRKITI